MQSFTERGSDTIVLSPQSQYFRFGYANQLQPMDILNVIAFPCQDTAYFEEFELFHNKILQDTPNLFEAMKVIEEDLRDKDQVFDIETKYKQPSKKRNRGRPKVGEIGIQDNTYEEESTHDENVIRINAMSDSSDEEDNQQTSKQPEKFVIGRPALQTPSNYFKY